MGRVKDHFWDEINAQGEQEDEWPARHSPTDRAEEAVTLMAHEIVQLEDALRAGAVLSDQKKQNLAAFVTRLKRLELVP